MKLPSVPGKKFPPGEKKNFWASQERKADPSEEREKESLGELA